MNRNQHEYIFIFYALRIITEMDVIFIFNKFNNENAITFTPR